jgi:hypothetical protein
MLPTVPLPANRPTIEDKLALLPVKPPAQVLDVLSEFAPGQKLLAQIQVQLANGAYRATIAQRDVTLALPFSAKAGDSLELEVVETDGRVAFAVVPPRLVKGELESSASASISRAGLLISDLLGSVTEEVEAKPPGVLLARGEPLAEKPPAKAADIAPLLEKAIVKSGLFYESHQAKWISGAQLTEALLDEPQTLLAPANHPSQADSLVKTAPALPDATKLAPGGGAQPLIARAAGRETEVRPASPEQNAVAVADVENAAATTARRAIPEEIAPLVQQQLTGLANNVYAFHGLAWPGQRIEWEIIDQDDEGRSGAGGDAPAPWKTRLRLSLPSLGSIDASLQLNGNTLAVHLTAPTGEATHVLRNAAPQLEQRLADAGLQLVALQVEKQADDGEADAPAA